MTSNDSQGSAEKLRKEALALHRALDGGLDSALQANGYELLGLSLKIGERDCLLTMRLLHHKGSFVAFVGGPSAPGCIVKASREAKGAKLRYRPDRYQDGG